MAQRVECLLYEREDQSLDPQPSRSKQLWRCIFVVPELGAETGTSQGLAGLAGPSVQLKQ